MPRATKDARLESAAARARLSARKKPHYRLIDTGLHVGYYRGANGGSWIARRYLGAGVYETQRLGLADDGREADGTAVLTFSQVQRKAREWATRQERQAAGIEDATPWTVRDAVEHYLDDYSARGGKARRYVDTTFKAHILPKLGDRAIRDLTPAMIRAWHRGVATAPPRLRTSASAEKMRERILAPDDADAHRARRATANGVLTLLKAALNFAYGEGKVPTDDAWRRVKPFEKVQAARIRYLTDSEASRLVNACPMDLRQLVIGALLTGCRYQELATLRPADLDLEAGVLTIRASKAGGSRSVVLTSEAAGFFRQAAAGKVRIARLLPKADGSPWGKSHQFRPLRYACQAAGIAPAISFHILRHTHASRLAMKGVPMHVIAAQLGHASVKMTERHYAHLSPGYVADTIRSAFGSLGLVQASNVVSIHRDTSTANMRL
jgi:integrase